MNRAQLSLFGLLISGSACCLAQVDDFKPNGSLGFTQTFYGDAGRYKTATVHPSLLLNYNFTSALSASLEWDKTWNMHSYNGGRKQQDNHFSEPKATLNYDAGTLFNSQVDWSSSLLFESENSFDGSISNYAMLSTTFDFSSYIPGSDFIKATQFAVSPMYVYGWEAKGDSGHVNTAALGLLTTWQLPANFSLTLNGYVFKDWYNGSMRVAGQRSMYRSANYFMIIALLNYSNTLYKFSDKSSLDFNFTGGFDPYVSSNRKGAWDPFLIGNQMYEWLSPTEMNGNYKSTYTAFALPQLKLNYQVSDELGLNAFAQVKYSNQVWGETEKSWRLQPQLGFGATYNF